MKPVAGFLMVVALSASWAVAACGGGDHPVMSARKDGGIQIGLFIDQAQVKRTQPWKPEQGEPPLSVSAAYQAATQWGRQHYIRYDDVNVRELSLRNYRCSALRDRWYYVFDLNPVIDGNELWSIGNWAAVLMDGTVIGPREY